MQLGSSPYTILNAASTKFECYLYLLGYLFFSFILLFYFELPSIALIKFFVHSPECSCKLGYDGGQDAVFNYSDIYLMTYEVGFEYWDTMARMFKPYNSHFQMMEDRYRRSGHISLLPSKNTHR